MYKTIIESFELILKTSLREVPEKRIVFQGEWQNSAVIVKIFHHKNSARRHWKRDVDGIKAFQDNGISTPKLLWYGKLPDIDGLKLSGDAWALIVEELPEVQSSLDAWESSSPEEKRTLAGKLVRVLASHNRARLLQTDIHFGNFLISKGTVYSIDGDGIEEYQEKIPIEKAADNLAFLLVQADVLSQKYFKEMLPEYLKITGYDEQEFKKEFRKYIKERFNWRCNKYIKKVFRNCTDIDFIKTAGRKTWVTKKYKSETLLKYCENPESLFPDSLDDLLKNGNSATVALVEVDGLKLVVKRYNYNKNLRTFIRRFRTSRGAVSWENSHMLMHFGLKTPTPVALIESYAGPAVKHAYYITLFEEGKDALSWFKDENVPKKDKEAAAEKFYQIMTVFDKCSITHGDLKATNFIITPDKDIAIIDLDAMHRHSNSGTYSKAKEKDMKRWWKNWQDSPEIEQIFKSADS